MQLPSLPHDNLYKFMAFSGLAILFGVNYLWVTHLADLSDDYIRLSGDYRQIMKDYTVLETAITKTIDALRQRPTPSQLADLEGEAADQEKTKAALGARMTELETRSRLLDHRDVDQKALELLATIGTLAGIILALIGSILWYVRIQGPQDRLLKKQLAEEHKVRTHRPRLRA